MTSPSQKENNLSIWVAIIGFVIPLFGFAASFFYLLFNRKQEAGLLATISLVGWMLWMIINR